MPKYTSKPPKLKKTDTSKPKGIWQKEKDNFAKAKEEPYSAKKTWLIVACIAVFIAVIIDASDGDKLGTTEAIQLCISDFRSQYGQNVDVHLMRSTTLEEEHKIIVLVQGTKENMYGAEIRLSHICHVDKATNAVTSTEPGLPW